MAKYCGMIGFSMMVDHGHGVWEEELVEKKYYGEINRNTKQWQTSDKLNDNLVISNEISILANSFMKSNVGAMRYVTWEGMKWKINSATIDYPRITLVLGGLYNEQTA